MRVSQAHYARPQSATLGSKVRRLFAGKQEISRKSILADTGMRSYMVAPGQAVWSDRNYYQFSLEAYVKNVIAHRSITMVATAAASVPLCLYVTSMKGLRKEIRSHRVLDLLMRPNPAQASGGRAQTGERPLLR